MELKRPEGDGAVRPVPEHRADEELSVVYGDLKATLGVPWVGVVTQAFAHHRAFFFEAWRQLRPSAASDFFHAASDDLRLLALNEMSSSFTIDPQRPALEAMRYSEREIDQIAETLDLFNRGNPKYLILATVMRAGLAEGRRLGSATRPPESAPRPASPPPSLIGVVPAMVEEHHALGDLRALYGDIKATVNLPFVNSDYKAMARWPSYLQQAWTSLKPKIAEPAYARARQRLHTRVVDLMDELPFPFHVDRDAARALGMTERDIDELARTTELFQWLISGLMLNVSSFELALRR